MASPKTLEREKIVLLNSSISELHFSAICKKTSFNWGQSGANLLPRKAKDSSSLCYMEGPR